MKKMENRPLVPRPWWQVGLAVLPGLIFLLRQVTSPSTPLGVGLHYLLLAVMILLSISSVLLAAMRRSLFKVPVWGLIPLGLLAEWGLISIIDSLDFYPTCFLLVVMGLLFARRNGLSASLFVLAGGIVTINHHVEPVMYFWDSPFWRIFINVGMTVLFTILTPTLVLRSRSILRQAAGLLLPIAAYYIAFAFALYSVRGFPVSKSVSIADPVIVLFATIAVAVVLYEGFDTYRLGLGLLVLLLASCGPAPTVTPSTVPTATSEPTTAPMSTLLPTTTPLLRPTSTPPPTLTADPIGPFVPLPPAESQPPGNIHDWRVAPDGTLWLITSAGVGSLRQGTWTLHPEHGHIILGFDGAGRTWLTSKDGDSIAAWDGTAWTTYGSEAGWAPAGPVWPGGPYATISEEIVTDGRGWVWLATQKDVRVFDGRQWTIYAPEEVGFTRTEEMVEYGFDFSLTDVALDSTGDVWVADCAWMGPGPWGQGARWFNGEEWQGQDSPVVASGCIEDIEVDAAGRIWVGVDGNLWRYTPGERWTLFPHPEPDPNWERRWGWIADVELGGEETAWVTMSPCGGASCDSGVFILFRVCNGTWTQVSEEGLGDLAFDSSGEGWLCIGDGLYHVVEETVELVFEQDFFHCGVEVDPAGRVWLAIPGQPTLWLYDRTGSD